MSRNRNSIATTVCCFAFLILFAGWIITHSYWFLGASAVAGLCVLALVAAAIQR